MQGNYSYDGYDHNTPDVQTLETMCDTIEAEKEYLSELDGAIGDGDHGVNMAKCFREVKKKLAASSAEDVGALFKEVGMVVLNSVGGAMGALYGTFFLKMAQESAAKSEVGLSDLVRMFQTAEQGILDIGKASLGDKTLIDTLSPAVRAIEALTTKANPLPRPWRISNRPPNKAWNPPKTCWPKWAVPAAWEKEPSGTRTRAPRPAILFCDHWHQQLHNERQIIPIQLSKADYRTNPPSASISKKATDMTISFQVSR